MTALWDALRGARAYDLEQPRGAGDPVWPSHEPGLLLSLHRRHESGTGERRTSASALLVLAEHSGTHVDALCHQAEEGRLHGGVAVDHEVQTPRGFTALGAETIAPMLARGVLLDLGELPGKHVVSAGELAAAAEGVAIAPGDVVLVRTGNGARWEDREAYMDGPGMGADASAWLAERRPLAVGCDTIAWDVPGLEDPELGTLPGHTLLIVRAGIHILENLRLEALAADGVGEFAFVCLPLKLRGATGSPVRPVALVEG